MGKLKQFYQDNRPVVLGLAAGIATFCTVLSLSSPQKADKAQTRSIFLRDVTGDGLDDVVLDDGNRVLVAQGNGLYEETKLKVQDGYGFLVDSKGGAYDLKGHYLPPERK